MKRRKFFFFIVAMGFPKLMGISCAAGAAPSAQKQSAKIQIQTRPPTTGDFVRVRDDVRHPGYVPWHSGLTLREVIEAAGGFTDEARYIIIIPAGERRERDFMLLRDYLRDVKLRNKLLLKLDVVSVDHYRL